MLFLDKDVLQTSSDVWAEPVRLGHAPRILLLYGSLRARSYSRFAMLEAERILKYLGAETRIFHADSLLTLFADRILPLDTIAARHYAGLAVKARDAGMDFLTPDGSIAAIAAEHDFLVASRDTKAFNPVSLNVIDPWTVAD